MPFGSRNKHHNRCNIHLKSESITGQPASKLVVVTKLSGNFRTVYVCIKNESICECYSRTLFADNVHEDCRNTSFNAALPRQPEHNLQHSTSYTTRTHPVTLPFLHISNASLGIVLLTRFKSALLTQRRQILQHCPFYIPETDSVYTIRTHPSKPPFPHNCK